jgi:hypothetical protein
MLAQRLDGAYQLYGEHIYGAFMQHLQAEHPARKSKNIDKILTENPFELIQILLKLKEKGIFKGTCQICQDQ